MRSIAALAVAYFIAGKLGLKLAIVHAQATAVWPPTGIALAALLLWGYRLWPGILIGAFLVNVTTGGAITITQTLASIGIATGNTLEALLGAYLLNRFARGRRSFDRAQDIFAFAALTAMTSTTVSATFGVLSLALAGLAEWAKAAAIWGTWWIGDAAGDLIFAPPVIFWALEPRWRWSRDRALEAGLLLLIICALALSVFTNLLPPKSPHLGLAFLCAPPLFWAAFRFGQRESATALLLLSGIAIWGWFHGLQAGRLSPMYVLLELQAYLAVTAVTVLAVGAEVAQRRRHQEALELQAEVLRQQARLLDLAQVLVRDTEDRITAWNSGAERLYGFTREEAVGQVSHTLLQTRFPEPLEEIRARLFAIGTWEGELEQKARDGREVVVASLWVLQRDKGAPAAILEVDNDITELKRTEAARRQLAAIVESSEDAIIGKAPDGTIASWNRGAERIYGYRAEEVIGRPISILAPGGHEQEMPAIMERIQRGESVEHFDTQRRRKDGTIIDVSVTVSPIKSHIGEIIGASVVARDITARRRLEEQFRQAQKLESIGVLAGGVAHDFNNLLVGILGNASLAVQFLPASHPARASLEDVVRAGERAAALVRQLLAYAGKGRFMTQPVGLSEVVREIAGLVRSSIPKAVDLRFDFPNEVPAILGDATQIQQLLMNLLINAGEAMGQNTGTILVCASVREIDESSIRGTRGYEEIGPGRYIELQVQDTGCGMDEETRSRIFDPFFTTKFMGRGLGLAAVLGIVRGHKGAIQVQSAPGRGTTFKVLLPATDDQPSAWKAAPVSTDLSGAGTILVVDDEEVVRRTAKSALESHGYQVVLAGSGREGVEIFRRMADEIVVVLLDMTMPVMSGEEAIGHLKEARPNVPVIASSGYNEALAMQRFAGKGIAGFIQKPYTAQQLAAKIKGVLAESGHKAG
jgi:PAS domain S-box-containing protein